MDINVVVPGAPPRPATCPEVPGESATPFAVQAVFSDSPERKRVEGLVRQVYARAYGAEISCFCDCLLTLQHGNELYGTVGIRPASADGFFLQQYLDRPVSDYLRDAVGTEAGSTVTVEIGNLAAGETGAGRSLLVALAAFLHGAGAAWIMFTAVRPLLHLLVRAGFDPRRLAVADRRRLRPGTDRWGRYYDRTATVCIGSIDAAAALLARDLTHRDATTTLLWDAAWSLGSLHRDWIAGTPRGTPAACP